MAQSGVVTTPPPTRTIDWQSLVVRQWGAEYLQPDIAYVWSNGRRFEDDMGYGGIYRPNEQS